jgi:hypothetical protein
MDEEGHMSGIERDEFGSEPIHEQRARRRVFWLGLAAASLAAVVASAIAIGAAGEARATRGLFGRAHGPHGAEAREAAREHAELAAEWLLRSVDASEQQQARVREIVDASLAELPRWPTSTAPIARRSPTFAQETTTRGAREPAGAGDRAGGAGLAHAGGQGRRRGRGADARPAGRAARIRLALPPLGTWSRLVRRARTPAGPAGPWPSAFC